METIMVKVALKASFSQDSSGWWTANSNFGMASGPTKEECIRVLTERVQGR